MKVFYYLKCVFKAIKLFLEYVVQEQTEFSKNFPVIVFKYLSGIPLVIICLSIKKYNHMIGLNIVSYC